MDESLTKLLGQAGFTEKEAGVYLALLQLGQGDVTEIAKTAELKRSIVYVLLEGLIKRGYAGEIPEKKPARFQAADPATILNQLKTLTKNFSEMLPLFRTLHNKGRSRPKIFYQEDKKAILKTLDDMNQYEKAFFITSYQRIDSCFPGMMEKWIADWKKGVIPVRGRHIVGNNSFDLGVGRRLQKEIGQKVKYLPEVEMFTMDLAIYEKKLTITSLEENPFMVTIESGELIKSIKILFEIAWEKAEELPK
jgi:predicted DNA-binding transcriptional regulator